MEREKNFEYAIKSLDGEISNISNYEDNVRECIGYINSDGPTGCKLVRREVGEWEEVK